MSPKSARRRRRRWTATRRSSPSRTAIGATTPSSRARRARTATRGTPGEPGPVRWPRRSRARAIAYHVGRRLARRYATPGAATLIRHNRPRALENGLVRRSVGCGTRLNGSTSRRTRACDGGGAACPTRVSPPRTVVAKLRRRPGGETPLSSWPRRSTARVGGLLHRHWSEPPVTRRFIAGRSVIVGGGQVAEPAVNTLGVCGGGLGRPTACGRRRPSSCTPSVDTRRRRRRRYSVKTGRGRRSNTASAVSTRRNARTTAGRHRRRHLSARATRRLCRRNRADRPRSLKTAWAAESAVNGATVSRSRFTAERGLRGYVHCRRGQTLGVSPRSLPGRSRSSFFVRHH